MKASVIGAGLAGCEAAYQLAKRGIEVDLYEMKPKRRSPAHNADTLAELVCSNSLRSDRLQNGAGLMKEEMRRLDSLIMSCADSCRVPAGGALAVDRDTFTRCVTDRIKSNPNINLICEEITELPKAPAIVATGPLTDGALYKAIEDFFGEGLHFYDAAAPIVRADSLDIDKVFRASRYERGSDYLNCPMTREEYFTFVHELVNAETAPLKEFETPRVFEGCMPIEIMAKRGDMTLAFGPLKPVGLRDERTGVKPFAVVQLRQDDSDGTLYNIVGFQTNLKFGEQRRVFGLIPGLEHAEYERYGVMHRNTFINSPGKLSFNYEVLSRPGLFFAGQMNGSSGYEEAAAQGLYAGINAALWIKGEEPLILSRADAYIGVLCDDLTGKGTNEPYRMMTSRAEYRLLLRQDNADERLTELSRRTGLISDERYARLMKKQQEIVNARIKLEKSVPPEEKLIKLMESRGETPPKTGIKLSELLRRRSIGYSDLVMLYPEKVDDISAEAAEQVELNERYAGYIEKERLHVEKFSEMENALLPKDTDYSQIAGLRLEARQKLNKMQPESLGRASRISGVSPADIAVLMIWLKRRKEAE